jgi:hypothetical protein
VCCATTGFASKSNGLNAIKKRETASLSCHRPLSRGSHPVPPAGSRKIASGPLPPAESPKAEIRNKRKRMKDESQKYQKPKAAQTGSVGIGSTTRHLSRVRVYAPPPRPPRPLASTPACENQPPPSVTAARVSQTTAWNWLCDAATFLRFNLNSSDFVISGIKSLGCEYLEAALQSDVNPACWSFQACAQSYLV